MIINAAYFALLIVNYKILGIVWGLYTTQRFRWALFGLATWVCITIVYRI